MGTVTVNGKSYDIPNGACVTVFDGRITVNGNVITSGVKADQILIKGNCQELKSDLSVEVHGTIGGNVTAGGSANCSDVEGNVTAGGSVNCGDVGGNVKAGGSVNCGDVGGCV